MHPDKVMHCNARHLVNIKEKNKTKTTKPNKNKNWLSPECHCYL